LIEKISLRNASLAFRHFPDDDFVVAYDCVSGDTHLLTNLGYEICLILSRSEQTPSALKLYLAQSFGDMDEATFEETVDLALGQLEMSNLIRIQPS
jgi:PqqD family protein of HPr-rel-A system